MTTDCPTAPILFDHLVDEIEAGRDAEAVLLLAGMLDAVEGDARRAAAFHAALLAHPLHRFLKHPPHRGFGRARLGFERGLAARVALGALAVETGWKRGKRILVFHCGGDGELAGLAGQSLDNIVIEPAGDPFGTTRHDLILASHLCDHWPEDALSGQLARLRNRLNRDGVLAVASFVPGHLGQGLRQMCAGTRLYCHSEAGLTRAAARAGLRLTAFRDASNSLIWAELRAAPKPCDQQGDRT